jgi:hypothetical protein
MLTSAGNTDGSRDRRRCAAGHVGAENVGRGQIMPSVPREDWPYSGEMTHPPPLEPVSIYPQTGHGDDGSPRVTDAQRLAEQGTVHRFARDRRAPRATGPAAPLPYAHRPAGMTTRTSSPPGLTPPAATSPICNHRSLRTADRRWGG